MLRSTLIGAAKYFLGAAGYQITKIQKKRPIAALLADQPTWVNEIIATVGPYTMTSPERVASLCNAVEYILRFDIPGDIVECGVWKGGSMMAAALTLLKLGERTRKLRLFDTFEGMPEPTADDKTIYSGERNVVLASELLARPNPSEYLLACSPLEEVQRNMLSVGYPANLIEYIKGKVEETLPSHSAGQIALLRLDTDWYESTRHELLHLYPCLASRGVLIIDDYGHWEGARKAVDEFFQQNNVPILLNRVDYTSRIGIKPHI
jgi:O-methyltransferase